MSDVEYGLGRFGDRRLEKGGSSFTGRWWSAPVRSFVGWAEIAQEK